MAVEEFRIGGSFAAPFEVKLGQITTQETAAD